MWPALLIIAVVTAGDAEPAPPEPATPEPRPLPSLPATVAPIDPGPRRAAPVTGLVAVGLVKRVGTDSDDLPGTQGLAFDAVLTRRYGRLADLIDVGINFDFSYHRTNHQVSIPVPPAGAPDRGDAFRQLTHFDFAITLGMALKLGPTRTQVALGPGLDVAYFSTDEPRLGPAEARGTRTALRAAAGLDFSVSEQIALGVRFTFAHVFAAAPFEDAMGNDHSVFADRLGAGISMSYDF